MSKTLEAGAPAPSFELPADDGGTAALADYKGRTLVLYFYPKDDTAGCTKEAVEFSQSLKPFQKAGADILGVSKDSVTRHEKFKAKHELQVRLASDEEGEVCEAYGVWKEKSMYGRKFMGIERSTFLIGPDGKIARVWRKVRVPGHVDEVLEAVRQLK